MRPVDRLSSSVRVPDNRAASIIPPLSPSTVHLYPLPSFRSPPSPSLLSLFHPPSSHQPVIKTKLYGIPTRTGVVPVCPFGPERGSGRGRIGPHDGSSLDDRILPSRTRTRGTRRFGSGRVGFISDTIEDPANGRSVSWSDRCGPIKEDLLAFVSRRGPPREIDGKRIKRRLFESGQLWGSLWEANAYERIEDRRRSLQRNNRKIGITYDANHDRSIEF